LLNGGKIENILGVEVHLQTGRYFDTSLYVGTKEYGLISRSEFEDNMRNAGLSVGFYCPNPDAGFGCNYSLFVGLPIDKSNISPEEKERAINTLKSAGLPLRKFRWAFELRNHSYELPNRITENTLKVYSHPNDKYAGGRIEDILLE